MAAAASVAVHVVGIRDLQRALRDVDKALPRELRVVHKEVAARVLQVARRNATALGPMQARAAAEGMTAGAEQRSAYIKLRAGARKGAFVFGAEFGAARDTSRSRTTGTYVGYRQFRAWRGRGRDAGYFLYPAIRDEGRRIVDDYDRALGDLLRRHNLT